MHDFAALLNQRAGQVKRLTGRAGAPRHEPGCGATRENVCGGEARAARACRWRPRAGELEADDPCIQLEKLSPGDDCGERARSERGRGLLALQRSCWTGPTTGAHEPTAHAAAHRKVRETSMTGSCVCEDSKVDRATNRCLVVVLLWVRAYVC